MRLPRDEHDPILDDLLAGTVAAAKEAAAAVMQLYRSSQTVWEKGDDGDKVVTHASGEEIRNPLTEADLAADTILKEALGALLPEAGWLSEETGDSPERLERDAVWIVDPIDGTREYTMGIPEFSVSVGLSLRGRPVLGVLLNPATGELITARSGSGVMRNGEPVPPASSRNVVEGAVLLASRTEARRGEFEPFRARFEVREVGSTAWKLGMIAAGLGDAYFTRKPRNEWDVAAGIHLCREAGLAVTDLGRTEHVFNRTSPLCRGVVAAAPAIYDEIMTIIESIGTLE
jgi:myo-inositol-1(or 4)-monophosphatase